MLTVYFQKASASSSQKTAPLGSSLGRSLASSAGGPTTFSLKPPAPTAWGKGSLVCNTNGKTNTNINSDILVDLEDVASEAA